MMYLVPNVFVPIATNDHLYNTKKNNKWRITLINWNDL